MSLIEIAGGFTLPVPPLGTSFGANIGTLALDAEAEQIGWYFQAPKSGNVTNLLVRTAGVAGGDFTCDVDLDTITAAGLPAGSPVASKSAHVFANADDNQIIDITLDSAGAVTQGTWYAVTVTVNAGGLGGSSILFTYMPDEGGPGLTGMYHNTGGGWVKKDRTFKPMVGLIYDDATQPAIAGAWLLGKATNDVAGTVAVNNTDAPRYFGAKFQLPFRARCCGCWIWGDWTEDFSVLLLGADGDSSSPVASLSVDGDTTAATFDVVERFILNTSVTIEKNTDYYLAVVPTSASDIEINYWTFTDAAQHNMLPLGTSWAWVQSNTTPPVEAADWDVDTLKRFLGGLILDAVEVGGLLTHPGTSGGANG